MVQIRCRFNAHFSWDGLLDCKLIFWCKDDFFQYCYCNIGLFHFCSHFSYSSFLLLEVRGIYRYRDIWKSNREKNPLIDVLNWYKNKAKRLRGTTYAIAKLKDTTLVIHFPFTLPSQERGKKKRWMNYQKLWIKVMPFYSIKDLGENSKCFPIE